MLTALLTALAFASPTTMTHQGRVLGSLGDPINGSETLTIALYTTPTGGTAVWSEVDTVTVTDGYYSTVLGDTSPLSALTFAETAYWVSVTLASGDEMTPRTPISAVPTALSVAGGGAAAQSGPLVFGRANTGSQIGWVPFPRPLDEKPIIVTTVAEFNNSGPTDGRLVQISRGGFGIQTYTCSAATEVDSLSYLAMTAGQHTVDGHLFQAGETGPTTGSAFNITFPTPFDVLPVMFLMVDESRSNNGAVSCRMESLTTAGASGRCWNTVALDNAESVHWIATEPTSTGVTIDGRTLYAGHDTSATSSAHNITLPFTSQDVPEVVLLQPEHFGTSGGPSSTRMESQSGGNLIDTKSWLCSGNVERAPQRLHWLAVE